MYIDVTISAEKSLHRCIHMTYENIRCDETTYVIDDINMYLICLLFRSTCRDHPSFWWGSCCLFFSFLYCVMCTIVCLFVFFIFSHGVVSLFSIYDFDCPSGIFRPSFTLIRKKVKRFGLMNLFHRQLRNIKQSGHTN